ncbi:GntR family transcriptional regulator [Klebsiella pneumoniae]|nr:GntR family transcriptional regulator [Klebsiella pneumoniae]
MVGALLGYGEAAGDPLLREAIARHLALSRGIRCDIRQIVITEGALEGVNLCASLLTNPGDSVWLEEPGYLGARSGFQRAGLRVRGMAVDDEGMCIAKRRRGAAPAHFHLSFTPVSLWEHHERRAPSGARGICPPARGVDCGG